MNSITFYDGSVADLELARRRRDNSNWRQKETEAFLALLAGEEPTHAPHPADEWTVRAITELVNR